MKSKIIFPLICAMYISNSNSVNPEKYASKPLIVFPSKPTNTDLLRARVFLKNYNNDDPELVSALVTSNDDDENILQINSLMLLFAFEESSSNDPGALATPKINKLYSEKIFPKLIDTICKTAPQDLVKRSAWQILVTMPNLYNTFDALGYIQWESDNINISEYLEKYLNLIAKIAKTELPEKDILIIRLLQNLGTDIDSMPYEVDKNGRKIIIEDFSKICMYRDLINQKINEFKRKIEEENTKQEKTEE